ncbi:MAG: LD-carboxypeptidase [Nitrospirae bacterium]|nr:LD-carboxypeptidase [Nitrospirota bacterium]MBF0520660.1 LD-carboxypeptidase [Nitrospirota bacterium]MBF0534140.1 LD-carboxypeptidase [Nitrospirota bacterium]MBF0617027.1 LD-carboxypeptidase [Nitrospirota bacterium]
MKKLSLLPKRLSPGDKIGVVCPSNEIAGQKQTEELRRGIKFFENLGFKVERGKNLCSANPQDRANDINEFFLNPDIKAIFSAQGGDTSERVLKFIDWSAVSENPKIFMGLSDVTVFLNAIYTKTSLIPFHGGDVRYHYGKNPTEYDKTEFTDRLINGCTGKINPSGDRKTIRGGKGSGNLLGGNLRCLLKLVDTPFWPDFTGAILMLEALTMDELRCVEYLKILRQKGVFDKISGVIVGFVYSMEIEKPDAPQMEDILLMETRDYNFPILKVRDFGHGCPNTVLPIGAQIELNADNLTYKIVSNVI